MSLTPSARAQRAKVLQRLTKARQRAEEDLLVGIHDAAEAGMSQSDIAYAIGAKSSSVVGAKVRKGAALRAARRR